MGAVTLGSLRKKDKLKWAWATNHKTLIMEKKSRKKNEIEMFLRPLRIFQVSNINVTRSRQRAIEVCVPCCRTQLPTDSAHACLCESNDPWGGFYLMPVMQEVQRPGALWGAIEIHGLGSLHHLMTHATPQHSTMAPWGQYQFWKRDWLDALPVPLFSGKVSHLPNHWSLL